MARVTDHVPLSAEVLRAAYDYLSVTPPFIAWNLPPSDDIKFVVIRDRQVRGWYQRRQGRHTIAVSRTNVGRTHALLAVMAHEMLHLHQALTGMETDGEHNAAFQKLAGLVCRAHGFDPFEF